MPRVVFFVTSGADPLCFFSFFPVQAGYQGRGLSAEHAKMKAHHHPVRHEEDQSGCDVDGEERARGTPEVPPLTAAEQVLLP